MINFPAKIHYADNDEIKIVHQLNEIDKGRAFTIEELDIKWGRKLIVESLPMEND